MYYGKIDPLFAPDYHTFVIPKATANYRKPPKDARETFIVSDVTNLDALSKQFRIDQTKGPNPYYFATVYKPNAAYYCLLPVTVPLDVVTVPFQILIVYAIYAGFGHQ